MGNAQRFPRAVGSSGKPARSARRESDGGFPLLPIARHFHGARDFSRVTITAPGAPFKAHYRMDVDPGANLEDASVTTIALQADDQQCYE